MQTKTLITAIFLATLSLFSSISFAEIREISALQEAYELALDKAETYGPENVLVVFDIDNTLLATKQNFGSDQWYEWQSEMIKNGETTHAVAADIGGLLSVQAQLYALSNMRPTQADGSALVAGIQNRGISTIALTARGPANRDATQRELKENGFQLARRPLGIGNGFAGLYLPLNPQSPQLSGLTLGEVGQFNLQRPRKVSYEHGVMMVAGQHKGAMLRSLLHRTASSPSVVIFVDDKLHNVKNVEAGLAPLGIETFSLRINVEDAVVESFNSGDKAEVIAAWENLGAVINNIFQDAA